MNELRDRIKALGYVRHKLVVQVRLHDYVCTTGQLNLH